MTLAFEPDAGHGEGEVAVDETLVERAAELADRIRSGGEIDLESLLLDDSGCAMALRALLPSIALLADLRASEPDEIYLGEGPSGDPGIEKEPGRLGDFQLIRELGRGGMGVVYEAEQISLGRRVALKVLPRQASGDRMVQERFRREARTAARLHHTNIVPVYDVGQDGDVSFYAMQLIQGQGFDALITELRRLRDRADADSSLSTDSGSRSIKTRGEDSGQGIEKPTVGEGVEVSLVSRSILSGRFDRDSPGLEPAEALQPASAGDLAVGRATSVRAEGLKSGRRVFFRSVAQIGRQVAGALAYAHGRGIVHRDIKPSNLLLDTEGVAWIVDFGLANDVDDGLTQSGDILGTLRYMAPERFRGEGDARHDVYGLGLSLYELLTLRPGLDSSDRLELIEQIKTIQPRQLQAIDARIPRDLETIVLKAIEKDPQARYQSAEVMEEDLRLFLADEPIRARRVKGTFSKLISTQSQ